MILKSGLAFAAFAAASISLVNAGELADACVAALEADGRDPSGCTCLEEEIEANDLMDEFLQLGQIADPAERYAAASDEARAAMNKCTR